MTALIKSIQSRIHLCIFALVVLVIAIVIKFILYHTVLHSASAVYIYGDMSGDDVGYSVKSSIHGSLEHGVAFLNDATESKHRKTNKNHNEPNGFQFGVALTNNPVKYLQLMPNTVNSFSLTRLDFSSFFGQIESLHAGDLSDKQLLLNDVELAKKINDTLFFEVTGDNPSVTIDVQKSVDNIWLEYVFPWLMAVLLAYFLLYTIEWKKIHAISDIQPNTPMGKVNYQQLNGFRGLAAIYVVFEHTHPAGIGLGHLGVLMFFSLSGFLLSIPFVNRPENILSLSYLGHYFSRRVRRIVPLFFVIVTVTMLFQGHIYKAIRHYLFLQGDGYLWTIQQEMVFYLLLPMILLVNYFLSKRVMLLVVLLFIASFGFAHYLSKDIVYLYGLNSHKKLYIGVFLMGVAMAYFYHRIYLNSDGLQAFIGRHARAISVISIILLSLSIYYSRRDALPNYSGLIVARFDIYFAFVNVLLMFSMIALPKSLLGRLFASKVLVGLGIVGYSLYLLHPEIIDVVKALWYLWFAIPLTPLISFTLTLVLSYVISIFSYSYIEKPFIKSGKPRKVN